MKINELAAVIFSMFIVKFLYDAPIDAVFILPIFFIGFYLLFKLSPTYDYSSLFSTSLFVLILAFFFFSRPTFTIGILILIVVFLFYNYPIFLFKKGFKEEKDVYIKKNMKVVFSYKKEGLSKDIISIIEEVESSTKDNTGLVVNFCLNYGGRSEIVDACKKIIDDKIDKNDITEDLFKDYLYNKLPDIDLMIRTSGEQRISNFMLWSLSYSELYFTKTYFPAFTTTELLEIIDDFNNRDRRYGNAK